MDFITGLPHSNGFDCIWVVIDHFTKYAHFVELRHPFTAKSLAAIFAKEVVHLYGVPRSIVSGSGLIFLRNFWKELFTKWDIDIISFVHIYKHGLMLDLNAFMVFISLLKPLESICQSKGTFKACLGQQG